MPIPNRDLVRRQFGANAKKYATSPVHAKGASLGKLVDLLPLSDSCRALDIASAAGHVALALAPHVSSVVSSDLTPEMLELAQSRATEAGLSNLVTKLADAEDLPFDDESFDLATCRIAPHHFTNPGRFVAEMVRVVKPGGYFGLVDNVVPSDPYVADFVNQWEAKRDPSHVRCLSADEWLILFLEANIEIMHTELISKEMDFRLWADNMAVPSDVQSKLLDALLAAPTTVKEFLRPTETSFHLTELVLIGRKPQTEVPTR